MSNSLTINTPNIVQQNTPLRNVPSGSTATPDYSVKYVPQDLTDEQQAQARQNIGAISASEIPASAQANWNETDTESPAYIQNKPTIPAAQVQADWNQSDDTAVDYIKNKPTISGPDFSVVEDMEGSLIFYSNAYGQSVQFNNGSYQQLLADTVISDGVYHSYPNKTNSFGLSGKTIVHIPSVSGVRTHTGYFRFYPDSTIDYVWLHTSRSWNGISNMMILAEPFYQDLMCKDANIVINFGKTQQWSLYKINHTTSQNIQKFTVWTVNNTLWREIWTGTGDVVMFDTDAYFKNNAEAPASLIGFTLYLPKNRYSSIVAQLKSDFGDSAVENYILPQVQTYDFIYSEDFKYKMITLG